MPKRNCGDPRARADPVGESEPKPRGRSVEVINQIPFISVLLNFKFCNFAEAIHFGKPIKHLKLTKDSQRLHLTKCLYKNTDPEFKLFTKCQCSKEME